MSNVYCHLIQLIYKHCHFINIHVHLSCIMAFQQDTELIYSSHIHTWIWFIFNNITFPYAFRNWEVCSFNFLLGVSPRSKRQFNHHRSTIHVYWPRASGSVNISLPFHCFCFHDIVYIPYQMILGVTKYSSILANCLRPPQTHLGCHLKRSLSHNKSTRKSMTCICIINKHLGDK